jgi:SAM-dependent methyltransferase
MNASSEYTVRDQERMEHARRYFEWQFSMARKHLSARVLEVGCGLGNFTQYLTGRDLVVGIDNEPRCVEKHQKRFAGHANVVTISMDVLSSEFLELRRYEPSSIACLNVLEHVKDDAQALVHMNTVLPRGGTAVLIVPAFRSLYGPVDQKLGHYRRYSKRTLTRMAQDAGFRPRILRYINFAGFFGWWFNAHIFKKTEQSAAQIKIFDAAVVPVLSRLERWIHPLVGQSIFAVLVKSQP